MSLTSTDRCHKFTNFYIQYLISRHAFYRRDCLKVEPVSFLEWPLISVTVFTHHQDVHTACLRLTSARTMFAPPRSCPQRSARRRPRTSSRVVRLIIVFCVVERGAEKPQGTGTLASMIPSTDFCNNKFHQLELGNRNYTRVSRVSSSKKCSHLWEKETVACRNRECKFKERLFGCLVSSERGATVKGQHIRYVHGFIASYIVD